MSETSAEGSAARLWRRVARADVASGVEVAVAAVVLSAVGAAAVSGVEAAGAGVVLSAVLSAVGSDVAPGVAGSVSQASIVAASISSARHFTITPPPPPLATRRLRCTYRNA